MAKGGKPSVLKALAGKKVVLAGKFDYGRQAKLQQMSEAQQGKVLEELDRSVDYLVLADASASKTIQKQAVSLNGKGASIQVLEADAFEAILTPTPAELAAMIRGEECEALEKILPPEWGHHRAASAATVTEFREERFAGVKLKDVRLTQMGFFGCSFSGASFHGVSFGNATDCDFREISGEGAGFDDVVGSCFAKAKLSGLAIRGDFSRADFTGSELEKAAFDSQVYWLKNTKTKIDGAVFRKARLPGVRLVCLDLQAPDFHEADLTEAAIGGCDVTKGDFGGANLQRAMLVDCTLAGADFSGANLRGASLANCDLRKANFRGAELEGVNFRGARLDGADFKGAKNYDPKANTAGKSGPALTELDSVSAKARRIQVTFQLRGHDGADEEAGIDSSGLKYGWGARLPQSLNMRMVNSANQGQSFSAALLMMANLSANRTVRYETVEVSSTKSPKGGKELRDLVLRAIAEAYGQAIPAAEDLAAAEKAHRAARQAQGAAAREQREAAKAAAEKQKEKAKKQIAKKIEKAVGKVSDVATFLKALELRIEKPKIDKATKMLKASGFKLFNDVTEEHVSGVVKSQTDPDLVYACRVDHEGAYSCCTQNLNVCGGLRGSICKHLLVLIIGLVQAGELDPTTIDQWIAKTQTTKAELDKEIMGAIFIKYKGAEAGEVDWRPTETVPEDYYAL